MSEYYAVQRSSEYLAHYGVPGMKWGVRKYLDRSGKETAKSLSRYGPKANKFTSARKIQRDYNRLDQSYANINAERVDQTARLNKIKNKIIRKSFKYKSKGMPANQIVDKLKKKYDNKLKKTDSKIRESEAQMRGIERIQNRVLGTAAVNRYDVNGKAIQRIGQSRKDRRIATAAALTVGGALGGAAYGIASAAQGLKKGKSVLGNHIRVRKNGTGQISMTNYAALNKKYGGSTPSAPRHGRRRKST